MEDRTRLAPSGAAPRGGPTSTVAQEFAAEMDSFLKPDTVSNTDALEQTVEEKKSIVTSAEQELEELERRLRETEQRLQKVSRQSSPNRLAQQEHQTQHQLQQHEQSGQEEQMLGAAGSHEGRGPVADTAGYARERGAQQLQDVSR